MLAVLRYIAGRPASLSWAKLLPSFLAPFDETLEDDGRQKVFFDEPSQGNASLNFRSPVFSGNRIPEAAHDH